MRKQVAHDDKGSAVSKLPLMRQPFGVKMTRRSAAGLSLIEVLIAVLILAVGLLGMAGLQAFSLKNNTSAYHRSQANTLIYDILDALRSNRATILAYTSSTQVLKLDDSPSGKATRLEADLAAWADNLAHYLPIGDGEVECGASRGVCTITVYWDDTRALPSGKTCVDLPDDCQRMIITAGL
jgi:type IV pilus assembly protein PilV